MDTTIKLNFEQLKLYVSQIDLAEKIELVKILENETFPFRFKKLLNKIRTDDISYDEITAEVELIREKRLNEKSKN